MQDRLPVAQRIVVHRNRLSHEARFLLVSPPPAGQRFSVLPGAFAVCRLGPGEAVPAWATGEFASITRTPDELSVVCLAELVPPDVRAECDRDVRAALATLETPAGIPYTVHLLHVRLR